MNKNITGLDYTYNLSKVKKFLIWGIIGSVFTMIGDFLLLGVDSTGAEGLFGQYILAAEKISYVRIGWAGTFGYVGIPITALGFYVLYDILEDKASLLAKLYRISVYAYAAFGGAIHIICCYLVTGIKKASEIGTEADEMLAVILNEQGGYVVPCAIVFFLFYFINIVCMICIIAKKKTVLPNWLWIANPLTFKVLLNSIGKNWLFYSFKRNRLFKYELGVLAGVSSFVAFFIGLYPFDYQPTIWKVLIEGIVYYVGVGIVEEFYVRGLFLYIVETVLEKSRNKTQLAIGISSVVFGLGHIPGVIGMGVGVMLFKVVSTIGMGLYFGALYKKSNNLWLPIILHSFIDICALPYCFTSEMRYPTVSIVILVITYLILGIYGLIMMTTNKRQIMRI